MEQPTFMMQAHAADTATIDALMTALYASISGPAGERDWDRLRHLFRPDGTLASVKVEGGIVTLATMTLDAFIERAGAHMRSHEFHETEVSRRVERFGHIAHVFSTYQTRQDVEPVFARGINSLQLFWD